MKFYRIEPARKNFSTSFTPRVPYMTARNEDITSNRICVAPSIEECIYAAPYGVRGDGYSYYSIFRVFEFDINESDENLKNPEELNDKVPDIMDTNEHWITCNITASKVYYISCITDNNGMGIGYDIVPEEEIFDIIDVSDISESFNERDIKRILKNGFDDYDVLIDSFEIKKDKIHINSNYLFWGKKFKELFIEEI